MAQNTGNFPLNGKLGNVSGYTRKDSKKNFLRTPGGASRQKIKKDPKFANTRRLNTEFGGASSTAKNIKRAMTGLTHLDHSSFQSRLTSCCYIILKMDTKNVLGRREVYLSRHGHLLEGFNLEMGTFFDAIVKQPLGYTINRAEQSAMVVVPQLDPGVGLSVPGNFPLFRLIAVLGIVPDMKYSEKFDKYEPLNPSTQLLRQDFITEWFSTNIPSPEQMLELRISPDAGMTENDSLLLSIGIEFGIPETKAIIKSVKDKGAATILALR
jgi:hypothetical protein